MEASRVIDRRPVLLMHGIDDTAKELRPLAHRLRKGGWLNVELLEFTPNDASSGLVPLAHQVDRAARALAQKSGASEIDVVGFSMGALVTHYWLKRTPARIKVRRYVSISGPHHGTLTAYLRWNEGAAQMRPNSPFVQDLARDEGEWNGVEAYSFWTPMDLMIVPPSSSRLEGATERRFAVLAHPLMMYDRRVLAAVVEALQAPGTDRGRSSPPKERGSQAGNARLIPSVRLRRE
jgi:triacylglycerol lipase